MNYAKTINKVSRMLPRTARPIYKSQLAETSRRDFDVIVVGGGHAGTEACAAAARTGANTLLLTHKKSTLGAMSCNPSFGGVGKGHLMKEIDALDGICARVADISGIHYKVLNTRKGPAVWGYRAQIDRGIYAKHIKQELQELSNLHIIEGSVENLILEKPREPSPTHQKIYKAKCNGVVLATGARLYSPKVIITAGTFLRGEINLGLQKTPAGRMGDKPAIALAESLEQLGFRLGRLKTGTPPRIDKSTIDFSVCIEQIPDNPPIPFSFMNDKVSIKPEDQVACFLTHTNPAVNKIVHESLHLNSHVTEEVQGVRYCPSIESKVLSYPNTNHQVWLEPEGLNSPLIYPQGLSCTMPTEYQQKLLRTVKGLEACEIVQSGYGVEYDYINPQEVDKCLETNKVEGLYLAGQINGTTGYEEAAAQGIVAGANAAAQVLGKPPLIIDRSEAYIGVLIDDLTTLGTSEPYRMFPSRSEFKTRLRPDNADLRLTEKGYQTGCVGGDRYLVTRKLKRDFLDCVAVMESNVHTATKWAKMLGKSSTNHHEKTALEMMGLTGWNLSLSALAKLDTRYIRFAQSPKLERKIQLEAYYLESSRKELYSLERLKMHRSFEIPADFNYEDPKLHLKQEMKEKMGKIRPATIADASRIPGVTPGCLHALLPHVIIKNIDQP